MKKVITAILLLNLCMGLLFLGLQEKEILAAAAKTVNRTQETMADTEERQQEAAAGEGAAAAEGEEIKKIALTFDDGPHPYYTEELLDGLKERGVVATFFVTGEHANLHPDVIKRMQEEGHLIGNHTYSHMQLTKKNREKFKEELVRTIV